jgi:hypothetical protein
MRTLLFGLLTASLILSVSYRPPVAAGLARPQIKHTQKGSSPEVISAEIHIPDSNDLGTGTLPTKLSSRALPPAKVFSSALANPPAFQIAATVNPNGHVAVAIGRADGSRPAHSEIFRLPNTFDPDHAYTLVVRFAKWRIHAAELDGAPLATVVEAPTQR